MKPNKATLDLIKRFEGCRLEAYKDPIGVWTIGYGLTTGAIAGVNVGPRMIISQREADQYLSQVLHSFGNKILAMMKREPTPNQYGAMLSLAYNIGTGAFSRSTCLKRFNAGDMEGAAEALTWFNKAGGKVLRGLVRRREAERDLFLGTNVVDGSINITPDEPKTALKSTTNWAAGAAGVSMVAGASDDAKSIIDNLGVDPNLLLLLIGLAAVGWIFRERIKKLARGV